MKKTQNLTFSEKTNVSGKLDEYVEAVCACGLELRNLTFRKLKNKWPHCKCKQPMKVKSNADPLISTFN